MPMLWNFWKPYASGEVIFKFTSDLVNLFLDFTIGLLLGINVFD